MIVDTEVASIRNLARVRKFTAQAGGDVRFRWVDSVGTDDSPVCADVRRAIDDRGPVTLDELRECLREAAAEHDEGTPDRADDLIPHERCLEGGRRQVEADALEHLVGRGVAPDVTGVAETLLLTAEAQLLMAEALSLTAEAVSTGVRVRDGPRPNRGRWRAGRSR